MRNNNRTENAHKKMVSITMKILKTPSNIIYKRRVSVEHSLPSSDAKRTCYRQEGRS